MSNLRKHGIDFIDVVDFEWDTALVVPDTRKEYGEPRYIALGYLDDAVHCLIFTERGENKRIISLRKANGRERKRYEKTIQG